jgi:hypothetical protein
MGKLKSGWYCRAMLISLGTMPAGILATEVPPQLGTLNSFTGEVWINGAAAGPISAGRTTLEIGRSVKTGEGMAELLLTPGSFLRLGNHSELTLEAAGTPQVRVRLGTGEALIEVLDLRGSIVLEQNGVTAVVRKPGLYDFDYKRALMAVYAGEAQFSKGEKQIITGKGFGVRTRSLREIEAHPIPGSAIFSWSNFRSELLSSQSAASAQAYPSDSRNRPNPAWYWNPWSASYTYLSASGAVTGPFGWPYYSPGYTPNYIPVSQGGDSRLYGPPVPVMPGSTQPVAPASHNSVPVVPLTAPGVPEFPNNRLNSR